MTKPLLSGSPAPSFRVVETEEGFRVVLRPYPFPALKVGCIYGAVMTTGSTWRAWERCHSDPSFDLTAQLIAAIPTFFLTAGLYGLVLHVLNRFNHEELIINDDSFIVRPRYFGVCQTYSFERSEVQNLRLVQPDFWEYVKQSLRERKRIKLAEANSGGVGKRALCFDCRGRT